MHRGVVCALSLVLTHARMPQAGAYGDSFAAGILSFIVLSQGTGFQITGAPLQALEHVVLDGQQWMVRGRTWDWQVRGREITRPPGIALCNFPPASREAVGGERAAECRACAQRLRGDVTSGLTGTRVFGEGVL
mgnify:CR=1 FL=1